MATTQPKTIHLIKRTVTEEFVFDPDEIRSTFGDMLDAWSGSFEDFVLATFEEHDGSIFGDRFFYDTTNMNVGLEVIERGEDE